MSLFLLFISAFGAATIFPFYSEILFVGLLSSDYSLWLVWAVATLGNTLGAAVNWALGRFFLRFEDRKWFPFNTGKLSTAERWFQKYGKWSLLLAWLPLGGDALTFIAGTMRLNFGIFFILTGIGKGARYAFVLFAYLGLFS